MDRGVRANLPPCRGICQRDDGGSPGWECLSGTRTVGPGATGRYDRLIDRIVAVSGKPEVDRRPDIGVVRCRSDPLWETAGREIGQWAVRV